MPPAKPKALEVSKEAKFNYIPYICLQYPKYPSYFVSDSSTLPLKNGHNNWLRVVVIEGDPVETTHKSSSGAIATFRYAVLVLEGTATPDLLEREYNAFAAGQSTRADR